MPNPFCSGLHCSGADLIGEVTALEPLLGEVTSYLLFALGMILMLSVVLRRMTHVLKRSRRNSPKRQVAEIRKEMAATQPRTEMRLADAPQHYGRWHAEVNDIVRESYAQIDTKIATLQATIRLADETRIRLNQTIEQAGKLLDSLEPKQEAVEADSHHDEDSISQDTLARIASLYEEDQIQLDSLLKQLNQTIKGARPTSSAPAKPNLLETPSDDSSSLGPHGGESEDSPKSQEAHQTNEGESDPLFGDLTRQMRLDPAESNASFQPLSEKQAERARELLSQGNSVQTVASRIGVTVGEIELWRSLES